MSEKYVNNITTTLAGGIDAVTNTVVITSATGFPTTGTFRLLCGSELLLVTARTGTTLTATRGAEGTVAAVHADLATVEIVHTAGAIDQVRADQIDFGAFASRPAASKAGNIYLSTDGPYLSRDSGSVWTAFGPISKLTPVVQADFAWLNQLSATETAFGGAVVLETEASRASPSTVARIKTAPATPYTVTMCFKMSCKPSSSAGGSVNAFAGPCFREAATGKLLNLGAFQTDTPQRSVSFSQTGPTGAFSTVTNFVISIASPIWFQISNDGTNLVWRMSHDGYVWQQISTALKTVSFTTAPDQIGYFANQELVKMTVYSWLES